MGLARAPAAALMSGYVCLMTIPWESLTILVAVTLKSLIGVAFPVEGKYLVFSIFGRWIEEPVDPSRFF